MSERIEMALYRILGNDLPPRHDSRQTLRNLRFILENEHPPPDVERRWVLNRVADETVERELSSLIEAKGERQVRIPFDPAAYAARFIDASGLPERVDPVEVLHAPELARSEVLKLEWLYRHKNRYAINVNGARNLAIEDGRGDARWTLPFDGNIFVTAAGFAKLLALAGANPTARYLIVPISRVASNSDLLNPAFVPREFDEPQIAFRDDARDRFDEYLRYGNMNKAELLCRLGVPGPWNQWPRTQWEPRHRKAPQDAGCFAIGAWVGRLSAGAQARVEERIVERWSARIEGVVRHCAGLDQNLLDPVRLAKRRNCYRERFEILDPARDAIVAAADAILPLPPLSIAARKPMDIPGVTRNDYFSIAPHLHQTSGGRYSHVDGVRSAAADDPRSDRARFRIFVSRTVILAAAYEVTRERRYSGRGGEAVRTWFLDDTRHMRPHARFAQLRPDRIGETSFTAIIEFRHVWPLLDALRILAEAGDLSGGDVEGLQRWFTEFRDGWVASEAGRAASRAKNNIATFNDLTVAAISAFLGDTKTFSTLLSQAPARLHQQLRPAGAQPEEMARKRPLHYSLLNLQAWVSLAHLGRSAGIDIWRAPGSDRRSIPWAIRFACQKRALFSDYRQDSARFDQRLSLLLRSVPADAGDRDVLSDVPQLSGGYRRISTDDGVPPLWPMLGAVGGIEPHADDGGA